MVGELVPPGGVYAFLAEHHGELFPDSFIADLFAAKTGRPSLPADLIGSVLVLKELNDMSDPQTAEALKYDIRWKVACGRALTETSFDPSTLVYLVTQLGRLVPKGQTRHGFVVVCWGIDAMAPRFGMSQNNVARRAVEVSGAGELANRAAERGASISGVSSDAQTIPVNDCAGNSSRREQPSATRGCSCRTGRCVRCRSGASRLASRCRGRSGPGRQPIATASFWCARWVWVGVRRRRG